MSVLMDLHKDHVPSLGVGRDSTRDGGERIGVDNCILCSHELGQLFLQIQVDFCTRHNTFTINFITPRPNLEINAGNLEAKLFGMSAN